MFQFWVKLFGHSFQEHFLSNTVLLPNRFGKKTQTLITWVPKCQKFVIYPVRKDGKDELSRLESLQNFLNHLQIRAATQSGCVVTGNVYHIWTVWSIVLVFMEYFGLQAKENFIKDEN
jgi:hypothetical protein